MKLIQLNFLRQYDGLQLINPSRAFVFAIGFFMWITLNSVSSLADSTIENCQEVRGALDIGSGTSKLLVAKIDHCKSLIIETLIDIKEPIAWNEYLDKSTQMMISSEMTESGSRALQRLLDKALRYKARKIVGVATSVFRKARNGQDVIAKIEARTGVKIHLISQNEEAELGFESAVAALGSLGDNRKEDLLVWDIGGGSMQMYAHPSTGAEVYLGNLASVTLKNLYLEFMGHDQSVSPNPLKENAERLFRLVRYYAKTHLPAYFLNRSSQLKVIGVGGVHSLSVQRLSAEGANSYTHDQVANALKSYSMKGDSDLTGEYRSTDVTNLALILGFMEAMNISKVQTVKANLGQGVLFHSSWW